MFLLAKNKRMKLTVFGLIDDTVHFKKNLDAKLFTFTMNFTYRFSTI